MPNQFERLDVQDMSFLEFEDRDTPVHIAALALFEAGPLDQPHGPSRRFDWLLLSLDEIERMSHRLRASGSTPTGR
ncbi:MAG: hypothetical protein JRJ58_00120 [Deltaproteobacteria bacterium]|nr:hypothetical protein [Deltaproteobacteria bacterium]